MLARTAEYLFWLAALLPFVASATRAPARSAETAAASPEAPLPSTSTSNARLAAKAAQSYPIT